MTETRDAACHCGAVRLRVALVDGLHTARRCDCSFCAMRGAVTVTATGDGIEIVEGADVLTLYRFNTETAQHYFCGRCGIYTHHRRRSHPDEYGVNVACLDGVSPFDLPLVVVHDGQAHPSDVGHSRVAGVLTYTRQEMPG
ncbi:GFA family protein [uncultured Jannaschia sp.]|uniref:GFA family protein n=1 Tax=uncultured Jannaschia sp. TaxID=293347 RepID=UPI002626E7E8|nr:GFA family protein [uncultured Jannaschia sp.]